MWKSTLNLGKGNRLPTQEGFPDALVSSRLGGGRVWELDRRGYRGEEAPEGKITDSFAFTFRTDERCRGIWRQGSSPPVVCCVSFSGSHFPSVGRALPTETLKGTLYSSELLGNQLTLQSHDLHLHFYNLGCCPTLSDTLENHVISIIESSTLRML